MIPNVQENYQGEALSLAKITGIDFDLDGRVVNDKNST
jgi:hypothetical protein